MICPWTIPLTFSGNNHVRRAGNMLIYFGWPQALGGAAVLAMVLVYLWRQKRNLSYLLFFSLFWFYMMALVSLVVFPFPAPSPSSSFRPDINLIPLNFGSCSLLFFC